MVDLAVEKTRAIINVIALYPSAVSLVCLSNIFLFAVLYFMVIQDGCGSVSRLLVVQP